MNNQRVYLRVVELPNELFGFLQFVVKKQRVEGDIDFCTILMSEGGQSGNLFYGAAGSSSGAEAWGSYINRIGTVANRLDTDIGILCRSKKFYLSLLHAVLFLFRLTFLDGFQAG